MKKEKTKPVKYAKAPISLRKPIKKKTFINKYEKQIEHPQDKKFLISCFEFKDDFYTARKNLTKADVKKLKSLLKIAKINRKGAVNFVPLIFASSIVTAIVIFFVVFANPLLGNALEKGLEAVFEAKAEVRGFRLSVVPLEFSVRGITVANKESPMTNLFEMAGTGIRLRTQAILRGKVYIEWITADEIRFGTPRKTSGALPARQVKDKEEKPPKPDAPPLVDIKNFDAMALINQEFSKLITPGLYDAASSAYIETSARWQQEVENANTRVVELRENTTRLTNINVNEIRDLETVRSTITDVNNAVSSASAAANDVTKIINDLESDLNAVRQMEANARNSISDDINYLKSFIDFGSGNAFAALEPFIRDMLSEEGEQYFNYGLIALDALEKIKAFADAQPPKEKPVKVPKVKFRGRDVAYPVINYPAFYLGRLSTDFPIDTWKWNILLQDVSSNPDFYPRKPTTLDFGFAEQNALLQRSVLFSGMADLRSDPPMHFNVDVTANKFPVSLGDQLGNIGIKGFTGDSDISLNMNRVNDAISAGGNIIVSQAKLLDPQGTVAEAVGTAIEQAGNVNLGISYTDNNLRITTNIADLLAQALRRLAEVYARSAMDQLEAAFRQKINEYIDGRFDAKDEIEGLLNLAKGDRAIIDQTTSALNTKRDELQQRITGAATQAIGDATRQAEEAAQAARDEATRRAEEAAQQAREEAERRAREEAEQAARNLIQGNLPNLPGRRP